jgi:hypothetical protein
LSEIDPKAKTIKEEWRVDGVEAGFPSPTTDGKGIAFVMDDSGKIHAMDVKTGKEAWNQKAGTLGKASLVYADGKIYAADAKNFVIIQPPEAGKKKAKVLSKVELGADAQTLGREYFIFGSPAVSDGRLFLQTAGGTFCIGPKEPKKQAVEIPAPPAEPSTKAEAGAAVAVVQVVPADEVVRAGEKANFKVRTFDEHGRLIAENVKAEWAIGPVMIPPPPAPAGSPPPAIPPQATPAGNLKGKVTADGEFTAENGPPQGGAITATVAGAKAPGFARVRVMPSLPWSFDFEKAVENKPPLTWLNAGGKFKVVEIDDKSTHAKNKVLLKTLDLDLYQIARTFFGDTHRADYTVEADIMVGSKQVGGFVNMPDAGVIANKYQLNLMGNAQQCTIVSWSGALPKEGQAGAAPFAGVPFSWQPDAWYHYKLSVQKAAKGADIRGKVWPKGSAEPDKWTVELHDDQPNPEGSPGLYGKSGVTPNKSEIYYDNIVVSPNAAK